MRTLWREWACRPAWLMVLAVSACGQPVPLDRVLDELHAVRHFPGVAMAPDGSRVAWTEEQPGGDTALFAARWQAGAARPERLGTGRSPVWSPDGRRLAYLGSRASAAQPQLWVAPAAGGRARAVTRLTGVLADPRWSPDGKRLAFLFIEGSTRIPGPFEAVAAPAGVAGESPVYQRLAVLDLETGAVRQVSRPDLYVYEYDWSPDGNRFVATAAPAPGDANWYIARVYTVDAASGNMQEICRPAMQVAVPRWSPAGGRVAFIGGLMSDEGITGGDIYTVPAAGGEPRNLTPGRKSSPNWLAWVAPDRIVFTEHAGGGSAVAALDPASSVVRALWSGGEDANGGGIRANFSLASDGETSAIVRSSWARPPEVWAGRTGEWGQITNANAARQPLWGEARDLNWAGDAGRVQGWLLYPRGFEPGRRYPLVVFVHGGPAGVIKPAWPGNFFEMAALAARGSFVLYPNPRGSYGQGEAFTRANVKDFGGGDLRDILAGVDEALKTAPIDPGRIGITGWSYGGFMTMWAVTQTTRFRAAVAGAGLANWQSYYGENSIDQWMIPYFGASVYDDPAVYAKSSPINFIKQVRTPSLVLVGERDGECPLPQSLEFWHALKTLGVPTELVVYPGEGHIFRQTANRRDAVKRTVEWFERYLAAADGR